MKYLRIASVAIALLMLMPILSASAFLWPSQPHIVAYVYDYGSGKYYRVWTNYWTNPVWFETGPDIYEVIVILNGNAYFIHFDKTQKYIFFYSYSDDVGLFNQPDSVDGTAYFYETDTTIYFADYVYTPSGPVTFMIYILK